MHATIADTWNGFNASLPPDTPEVTRDHIQGVFYSGAASLMNLIEQQHENGNQEAMVAALNAWFEECRVAIRNLAHWGVVFVPDVPAPETVPDTGIADHA